MRAMLLRVGIAAAVRNGVLLCAAVGVCALRVKRHESCPCSAVLRSVRLLLQFHACKRQRKRGEQASTLRVAAV